MLLLKIKGEFWVMGVHQFRAQLDGGRLKVGNDKMATLLHAHLADCECMCISICVRIRTLDSLQKK